MTIDEALDRVRQTEACWIVWSRDTGEVLAVVGTRPGAGRDDDIVRHLEGLSGFGVPVMSRQFRPGQVTREVLLAEREKAERVRTRVTTLTAWAAAPPEELLSVLEVGEYPPSMHRDVDSGIIVDHLWELHRDELTAVLPRLRALRHGPALSPLASANLEAYVLAIEGSETGLRSFWRGRGSRAGPDELALVDCFAHVETRDPQIINDLVVMVERPGMFGPRRSAMIALGKLGRVAGSRAADAIRSSVWDSSAEVVAQRDRVLQRIESPEVGWARCVDCCHGLVHRSNGWSAEECSRCVGLGFILPGM